jgi:hypothetical protein
MMKTGPKVFFLLGFARSKHCTGFGNGLCSGISSGNEFPGLPFLQEAGDKLGVHGMTGTLRNHIAKQRTA